VPDGWVFIMPVVWPVGSRWSYLERLRVQLADLGAVTGRREPHFPFPVNDLWCADYKGEFMLADRRYCYPLTITDFASRYLFACEALSTTKEAYAFPVLGA
jgi:hypothetical protein